MIFCKTIFTSQPNPGNKGFDEWIAKCDYVDKTTEVKEGVFFVNRFVVKVEIS